MRSTPAFVETRTDHAHRTVEDTVRQLGADAVYMLLHPGFTREARANRWHFAVRWARHLPVTLVLPEREFLGRTSHREGRIPNCRVLKVLSNNEPLWGMRARIQTGQILADMRARNVRRPLLWLYSASFAEAFAILPAVARVHHVTENYFDFDSVPSIYMERLRAVVGMADLNVAVSDGCAAPLRDLAAPDRLLVVNNGCDFTAYGAAGSPDPEVIALRRTFRRIAVFGGNINDRLDFDLITRATAANPDTCVFMVGAVHLGAANQEKFDALRRRPNVRAIGAVDPDRLPAIYRASDFGFIPYVHARLITENGFPLKALEFAAVGLPVVSTLMRPLLPFSPPLTITGTAGAFLDAFAAARREEVHSQSLRQLAAANDYDARFATIAEHLVMSERRNGAPLDVLGSPFGDATVEVVRDRLLRDRWSPSSLYWQARFLVWARLLNMVDRLPPPIRDRVVRTKRALFGQATVAK